MLAFRVLRISDLQRMKREGRKIVGVVAWDSRIAEIADRAGVDIVSVGDSVGVNLWGQAPEEISLEEMMLVCKAVRRGVKRALVSVDLPAREQSVEAALRLQECGAEMVKILGSTDLVRGVVRAGVPVFAEFHGGKDDTAMLVDHAKRLEDAGASLLDFRHSGPLAGEAVARAVTIPVIGGLGGGPWLDGRMRLALAAIGYLDSPVEQYANVAAIAHDALSAYAEDVRAGRQIKGQRG
ncbi:MAG TPA: 3-methyl-2-oxobutanoate hydroxymethyltransferase [Burkholderiales bacterium]|nr:3-methyl-2-oxobutanoate hydroxymethyltransferase [Burkholderiales bacterium]